MLKKLILENWKSFRYAELPIDPLTVLIGTNASGKSNAVDALAFLRQTAKGGSISHSLNAASIRGGSEWATLQKEEKLSLTAIIQGKDEQTEYHYSISIRTKPNVQIVDEGLIQIQEFESVKHSPKQVRLFHVNPSAPQDQKSLTVFLEDANIPSLDFVGTQSVLSFLPNFYFNVRNLSSRNQSRAHEGLDIVLEALQNISILDPIPSEMRVYSRISDELSSNASNIAGVLAALPKAKKEYIEKTILSYVTHLPERDIQRVWAEPVGILGRDAMLYCEESWASGEPPIVIDARGMSDGTLRFLAIVTALLTRPEGSQLVIEEVDNGLHPSRAELLLKMLRELGAKRKIDILVTTHNPALLNALEPEMIPFVVVAHRDAQTGESKLTPLDDIQRLPKLLASGHIGDLATQGKIEKSLSQ